MVNPYPGIQEKLSVSMKSTNSKVIDSSSVHYNSVHGRQTFHQNIKCIFRCFVFFHIFGNDTEQHRVKDKKLQIFIINIPLVTWDLLKLWFWGNHEIRHHPQNLQNNNKPPQNKQPPSPPPKVKCRLPIGNPLWPGLKPWVIGKCFAELSLSALLPSAEFVISWGKWFDKAMLMFLVIQFLTESTTYSCRCRWLVKASWPAVWFFQFFA